MLPHEVQAILHRLNDAGHQAYLVGGCVRDMLLGTAPHDWDITTSAMPEETMALFDHFAIPTGLQHGTVSVRSGAIWCEVTTFRADGEYPDHRHPAAVTFTRSLHEDLRRRDLTVNAMAMDVDGVLHDPFGGQEDLRHGILRCVGKPTQRFSEDALRILRTLRFSATLGFLIDEDTRRAMHLQRGDLAYVAAERVREELTKLLCGKGAGAILRDYADVIAVSIPELAPLFGFEQHNPHHDKDVWEHTIAVVDSIRPEPVLRWAALLHDAGKPSCFAMGDDGLGHFYGHAAQSTSIADSILSRLRFDHASRERIVRLVRYHDMPITADRKQIKRLLSKHGEEAARQLIALHRADACGQSALCASRLAMFDEAAGLIDELLAEESCFSLKDLSIKGDDVMALGFRGKEVGKALQACLDAVLDERVHNDRDELLAFLKGI